MTVVEDLARFVARSSWSDLSAVRATPSSFVCSTPWAVRSARWTHHLSELSEQSSESSAAARFAP